MQKLFSVLLLGTIFFTTSCTRVSDGILGGLKGEYWTHAATGIGASSGGRTQAGGGSLGPFNPGTYEGVGPEGHHDMVKVAVTFDAAKITALEVTYSHETEVFADMAYETLIPDMLAAQTYAVDAFSGATDTSRALIRAVEDAVRKAGGR